MTVGVRHALMWGLMLLAACWAGSAGISYGISRSVKGGDVGVHELEERLVEDGRERNVALERRLAGLWLDINNTFAHRENLDRLQEQVHGIGTAEGLSTALARIFLLLAAQGQLDPASIKGTYFGAVPGEQFDTCLRYLRTSGDEGADVIDYVCDPVAEAARFPLVVGSIR